MNTGKRILWIDYAKSICIYLVLLGHAHASQPVTDFIYTFHMPLFFFLSGCLFSFEKHPNFKEFAIKRFKGLMVPYLWINLITICSGYLQVVISAKMRQYPLLGIPP